MEKNNQNPELIAACWLYCWACKMYLAEKCPWCKNNVKAEKRCKTKLCCKEKWIPNCSHCHEYTDYKKCKKLNNFISKIFAVVFWSNRFECINYIKKHWENKFAQHMSDIQSHNNPNKK